MVAVKLSVNESIIQELQNICACYKKTENEVVEALISVFYDANKNIIEKK